MKRENSESWRARSSARIPGCAQTFSKGPLSFVQGVLPNFLVRGEGAYVWDVDGNRFVDYILGLGPVILGHADRAVNEAACQQMAAGIAFSLPHPIEVEVAEALCERIPCAEMVRFGKNGSDVTAAAVRVSRAYTGRDKVLRCGYHGWQDWYVGSTSRFLGVPGAVRQLTLACAYNSLDAMHAVFHAHPGEIACVILEPATFDSPAPGYLEGVRELCSNQGALLVFDEIVTGFRVAIGGMQQLSGVTPDLACFGKAIANGFPLSAIVGRADVMRWFEQVFFSFTFGGEAVSLAACLATIRELERRDGVAALWRVGARLQEGARQRIREAGLAHLLDCVGLAPWTTMRATGLDERMGLLFRSYFQQEAAKRGLLTLGSHMLSVAHDDAIVDSTLAVYAEVLPLLSEAYREGSLERRLEGTPMQTVLRT